MFAHDRDGCASNNVWVYTKFHRNQTSLATLVDVFVA